MTAGDEAKSHSALLLGREHHDLGACVVASLSDSVAIAMSAGSASKGRVGKGNEDSGAVVSKGRAALLVVADAHFGPEAAEVAVDHIVTSIGGDISGAELTDEATASLFFRTGVAVQRETTRAGFPHPDTKTTLALARMTDDDVVWASIGDSCVFLASASGGTTGMGTPRSAYLGNRFTPADVAASVAYGRLRRSEVRAVVVATDGLVATLGRAGLEVASAVEEACRSNSAADEVAEALVSRALREGCDDAVTVAVALA